MLENLVVALLLTTGGLAYLLGRLNERSKRLKETQTLLAQTHLEMRAYKNQLLVAQGRPPIFEENGAISLKHVPDDAPVMQIMRPPFAQAEMDWEEEEKQNKITAQTIFVPDLTEQEKSEIRASMNGGSNGFNT